MLLVGLSALLAWLGVLLGKPKNQIRFVGIYLVSGMILVWISNLLAFTYWPWLVFFFLVIFTGTLLLRYGAHWFMMGWSLIYWLLLSPSLAINFEIDDLLSGFLAGGGSVLFLVILDWLLKKINGKNNFDRNDIEEITTVSWGKVIPYAVIVSLTIVFAMIIGNVWFKSDPTMIANSSFMIIGFSMVNTWKAGIERMLAALIGILIGFGLGYFLQSEVFGFVFYLLTSFFILAMIKVNNGAVVFFFLVSTAFGWGLLEYDVGSVLANQRIIAEIMGIILAGIAVTLLNEVNRLKL